MKKSIAEYRTYLVSGKTKYTAVGQELNRITMQAT